MRANFRLSSGSLEGKGGKEGEGEGEKGRGVEERERRGAEGKKVLENKTRYQCDKSGPT